MSATAENTNPAAAPTAPAYRFVVTEDGRVVDLPPAQAAGILAALAPGAGEAAAAQIPLLSAITGKERLPVSSTSDAGDEFDAEILVQQLLDAADARMRARLKSFLVALISVLQTEEGS